jgi:hypothetical protein
MWKGIVDELIIQSGFESVGIVITNGISGDKHKGQENTMNHESL